MKKNLLVGLHLFIFLFFWRNDIDFYGCLCAYIPAWNFFSFFYIMLWCFVMINNRSLQSPPYFFKNKKTLFGYPLQFIPFVWLEKKKKKLHWKLLQTLMAASVHTSWLSCLIIIILKKKIVLVIIERKYL